MYSSVRTQDDAAIPVDERREEDANRQVGPDDGREGRKVLERVGDEREEGVGDVHWECGSLAVKRQCESQDIRNEALVSGGSYSSARGSSRCTTAVAAM